MPRKLTLSIEQINEILNDKASESTILALKEFLTTELKRREKVAVKAIKPRKYSGTAKERNLQAVKRYQEKKKKAS